MGRIIRFSAFIIAFFVFIISFFFQSNKSEEIDYEDEI